MNSRGHNARGVTRGSRVTSAGCGIGVICTKRLRGSRIHLRFPRRPSGWGSGHGFHEHARTNPRTSEATGMGGECPRALVTTFEWCSLATCYLASCRCSGKVTCFKLHSFLFGILLVGVTDRRSRGICGARDKIQNSVRDCYPNSQSKKVCRTWVFSLRLNDGTQPLAMPFCSSVITDRSQTVQGSNKCRQLAPGINEIAK